MTLRGGSNLKSKQTHSCLKEKELQSSRECPEEGCFPSKCLFFSGLGLVAVANVRVRGTVCRFASAPGTDFRVNFPNHELWRSLEKPPLVLEFYTTAN